MTRRRKKSTAGGTASAAPRLVKRSEIEAREAARAAAARLAATPVPRRLVAAPRDEREARDAFAQLFGAAA